MQSVKLSKAKIIIIMIGVMVSNALIALDSTIIGTAMPRISSELNGTDLYTWPFTAYMLTSTIVMPIFGKLSDFYGRKIIHIIGTIAFTVFSVLCGLSSDMVQLSVFRALQGIGGGILASNTVAILADIFPPKERGKYQGFLFAVVGISSIVGPILGGLIADNYSWRYIFYINIPLGAAVLSAIFGLPSIKTDKSQKHIIDYKGSILLILTLVPILLTFSWAGKNFGWFSVPIILMIVFSILTFVTFILVERKAIEPVVPLNLFKNSIFCMSSIAAFFSNAIIFGMGMFVPLYMQSILGYNATKSGITLVYFMLGLVAASITSGIVMSKTGKYKLLAILGFTISGIGMGLIIGANGQTTYIFEVMYLVIAGIGIGIAVPIFNVTAQNAFSDSKVGTVNSVVQFFKNMGGTIGSTVLGAVMVHSVSIGLSDTVFKRLPTKVTDLILKNINSLDSIHNALEFKYLLSGSSTETVNSILEKLKVILNNSMNSVFITCIVFAVIGVIASIALKEIPLRKNKSLEEDVI
ncbi:MAG: MFS transporter [Clostridia bacterium]|nr:MFS transporter [Clostridia bacterium]